jgi:hypothetical protein
MYLASTVLTLNFILYISVLNIIAEGDFREVYRELVVNISAKYYNLGIELGLHPGQVDAIRKIHSQDVEQALNQVLLLWLRRQYDVDKYGPPTWQRLRKAVDSPSGGGNPALAEKIAEKHLISSMGHHSNLFSPPPLSIPLLLFLCCNDARVYQCYLYRYMY